MKGDFSRLTFDADKHYSRVLMQQGRVQLDADWNEQAEILLHYLRTLATDVIGPYGAPMALPGGVDSGGFEIRLVQEKLGSGPVIDLTIGGGRYYVDGLLCECADISYYQQPHRVFAPQEAGKELPGGRLLVYLDVWERHVTHLVDGRLREVALGGPDTATRTQVVWQVKVTDKGPDGPIPALTSKVARERWATWVNFFRPGPPGRLRARAMRGGDPTDACEASPAARFRGPENQLYRVEIQRVDAGAAGPVLGFKWARDNASRVFAVRELDGPTAHLESLGQDDASGLAPGTWVELVDDDASELGGPGPLAKVDEVDAARRTVKLVPRSDLPVKLGTHALLRRWDHRTANPDGVVTYTFVAADQEWLDLEDGVQIKFEPRSAEEPTRVFHPGDYWTIPARTATEDVEWPQDSEPAGPAESPPHGVVHHYAPLALLSGTKPPTDLRGKFSPIGV